MNRWIAPIVAGIVAGGVAFAAGTALSDDDGAGAPTTAPRPAAASGQTLFARMGCGGCHTLAAANSRGQFAPNLDERLPRHSRASLKAKIVNPYPGTQKPGEQEFFDGMPRDFGERMTAAELDTLVDFLLSTQEKSRANG